MIDLAVVSAFEPELAPLGLALRAPIARWGRQVWLEPIGIGPLDAAAGTADLLARVAPRAVVFVGTAGVFAHAAARWPLGTATFARETSGIVDLAPTGATQPIEVVRFRFDLDVALAPDAAAHVATTSAITVDDAAAATLGARGFDLESLEVAAVAAACMRKAIPCAASLGISNVVGASGRAQWREHHEAASRAACALLDRALSASVA